MLQSFQTPARSFSILKLFSYTLLAIFLVFIIFNAISISVKERSVVPAVKDLGNRFLLITFNIQEESQKIIDNKGFYTQTPNFWSGFFQTLWSGWKLYSNLYILVIWLWVLSKIYSFTPMSNEGNKFLNYSVALLTFFILQMMCLLLFREGNKFELIMIPFKAFYTFFIAIQYILQPIQELSNKVYPVANAT